MSSGVRQGGVLSPALFSVYSHDLNMSLSNGVGWNIAGHWMANLIYADDVCLPGPSTKAFHRLLDICSDFSA